MLGMKNMFRIKLSVKLCVTSETVLIKKCFVSSHASFHPTIIDCGCFKHALFVVKL